MEILRRFSLGSRPVKFRVSNDVRADLSDLGLTSQAGTQSSKSKKGSKKGSSQKGSNTKAKANANASKPNQIFESSPSSCANFLDPLTSVDLPIFSIHGNHDDPTRDGQGELLCSLDLLAAAGLVNYFGRQDDVDKVEIEAVLLEKGSTRVAIYGMGSMRDERLNR